MRGHKRHAAVFAVLAILTGGTIFATVQVTAEPEHEPPVVPDVLFVTLDGDEIGLHERLAMGPVLVSFWATWCKPCLKELPHVEAIHGAYADSGLTVLAVSIDRESFRARVAAYAQANGFSFTVCADFEKESFDALDGQSVPYTLLVGSGGDPAYVHVGYKPGDEVELERAVARALGMSPLGATAPPDSIDS